MLDAIYIVQILVHNMNKDLDPQTSLKQPKFCAVSLWVAVNRL